MCLAIVSEAFLEKIAVLAVPGSVCSILHLAVLVYLPVLAEHEQHRLQNNGSYLEMCYVLGF